MDAVDYRILQAVVAYHRLPPHPAPASDTTLEPVGLSEEQVEQVVRLWRGEASTSLGLVMCFAPAPLFDAAGDCC